jgi:predicted transcriptional regulator
MINQRANLSKTEAKIMKFMWAAKKPVVLSEVKAYFREEYQKEYANSTIHTLLQRMVAKGYISQGERYIAFSGYSYTCLVSEDEYLLQQLNQCRDIHFGGSACRFIVSLLQTQEITAEEQDKIQECMDELRRRSGR